SSCACFAAGVLNEGEGRARCGVAPPPPAAASPGGLRSKNAAPAARIKPSPPRIHHLYFDRGSGVLIGVPIPPPGWFPLPVLASGPAASGCPLVPAGCCAPGVPCCSRGIDPVPA